MQHSNPTVGNEQHKDRSLDEWKHDEYDEQCVDQ